MHLKKQQALLAGRNNSSPSSSIASQTAALPAGIDVTRSLTDQLTKLAKADKLALGGDSKSDTDSSTSTTEAAVTPVINTVSHSADRGDSSSNNNKVQELFSERHREASAFTCVQTTASRNSNNSIATTPLSDDRAESRGNEGQLVGEEQRPSSRPEERRIKSSPASSPLIVDRGEPVHPYRDPVLMSKNTVRSTLNTCVAPSLHKPLGGAVTYAVPTAVPVGLTTSSSSSSSTLTSPHPTSLARSLVPGLSYAHQLGPGVISHGLPMPHGYSQLDALTARGLAAAAAAQQQQMAALQQYQNTAHLLPTLPYSAALAGGGGGGGRLPQLEVLQKFPQGPVHSWLGDALLQREQLERKLEQDRLEREHLERLELERLERERMERAERERRERKEKMERERLEREKVEKEKAERLEREKAERERLEKERQERERLLEQREWEQRQERERILREAADTSAAVDQHFTASLSRLANQRGMAQGMWPPAPSISKGTGKGLLGKTELPSVSQGEKVSDHLEDDRIKREEHDRLVMGDDKRHIQGILEQRGDQKSEGVTGKDNKPIYGYPPYHYSSSGYPLFTTSSSGKPEAISFSLYGYQSQYSTMTTEQLQKKGLAPGSGRSVKEEKGIYPSPAHSSNPSPPRVSHMMPPHHRDMKPQSSVIVENKPVVKIENPVTAHSHHHSSSSLSSSSSSSSPRPRPAHMPEQRLDPPLSSAVSTNSSISHHIMASTTTTSMPPTSHTTAFCGMDAKGMSRAQSPYKMGSQLTPGPTQPPPPPQRQQASGLLQNQQQPINYCKSSGKIKGQNVPAQSGGPLQAAIAQPPVSSSIAYSYSLIQQGLVPNPMYTQGTVSASVPLGRSQATAAATTTITTTTTSTPSSVASVHNPYLSTGPPSATQQTGKHPQHSPTSGGNKRKAVSGGRDNGTIQKRSKAATAESEANKRRTPTTSMVSVPVTTPQVLINPSPYTTSSAVNLQPGNPPTATPDGFLDSFRSFVETTVHKAFLQDQELELEKEEHERLQKQELQQKQQQQGQGGFEKVDPPVVLSREDVSQSPLMPTTAPQTPVTMDMVNRVANGQVDTDSDTLSAPSPPPSQTRMDASPHGRGGAAIATKVKKAWLQRHSGEDKKCIVLQASPSPLALVQEDSNSSQSTSREVKCFLKDAVTSVLDSSASSANGEGTASPAPSIILANGNISDLKHANDESTSSASETESQSPAMAKKRAKSKKSIFSKKVKTEDRGSLSPTHGESNNTTPNNVRKKNPSKRPKTDSKDNPKPKEKQDTHETSSTLPSQLSIAKQSPVLAQSSASSSPITVKKTEGRPVKGLLPSKHACDDSPQPSSQDSEKDSDSNGKDRKKTRRSRDNFRESPSKNDSVATLKRTGAPFIQDGPCSEVTPKLSKCRECKMTPTQRSKKIPNIFCRFYAFRRLKYSAKGSVTIAGFSELSDADPDDIEPWLPRYPTEDPQLDDENAKFIIAKVGDKFCELVEQEKEAKSWAGDDAKIAWKRAVTGVREMCDVCDTTLFNMHWVCHKCGFVVCLDCYKSKMKSNADGKNEDCCKWLTCSSNRQAHEAEKLMLTQIIPSDALWELGRLIHDIRRKWSIPAKCPCGQNTIDSKSANKNGMNQQLVKKMMNGIGDESGKRGKKNLALHHNEDKLVEQDEFNQDSLALLANVAALRGGDKPDKRSSKAEKITEDDLLGEDGDKKSSGSCSTLRELLTKTAGKGKVPNEKKTRPKTSGSSLDNIIQSVVEKSCRDLDTGSQPFKFLHYIPRLGQWNRELPIIAHSLTETSVLYPDVPHSWLCDGRLLRLHDPRHKGNLKIFQEQWKRGQPVLVSCVNKLVNAELWHPESFSNEFGHLENDLVNCRNGNVIVGNPMKDFWDGFESIENRLLDEDSFPMLLKLKDWPPGDDFSDMLPSRFQDLMQALPLPEYTGRNGKLNLASRLPDFLVRPDLGPKMYNAYGSAKYPKEGTTNLHLDISDAVNVLVYVGVPSDGPRGRKEHEEAAVKAIDEAGCDNITKRRVREVHEIPGALWQIYDAHDADKIRDFLNKVAKERGETIEPDHDSIHDQSWYLDEELRERLLKEYGVQGYTIVQCLGDAIFIPAGAPHQVRNLHSCIKVAEDFVSPEHLNHCFRLTQEFRQLSDTHSNHEDKLQVKNIIYHAVKDAIAVLRELDPDDKK
ncbi:probable JmjC domain-containing histone demethylation protein 2C isoform X4 [Pomacea canaliculata]|uniref:probable JmjC domain-containing histone demethylation protein 2C isoform X4 n=1 Tax=Pomacea canaliculata TaxID=400727 RepID=UPI000D7362C0|nr:probable JmjC domain-containing histone demethylation protein 2C isoform X4 [Pomacea canaliculata]